VTLPVTRTVDMDLYDNEGFLNTIENEVTLIQPVYDDDFDHETTLPVAALLSRQRASIQLFRKYPGPLVAMR